jgi:hypothetical protein
MSKSKETYGQAIVEALEAYLQEVKMSRHSYQALEAKQKLINEIDNTIKELMDDELRK